uniref:T9SS type A sorting domain-containing protein n=1 Tax=Flavobacterium sp. TaxID=239 RepID=UPI00334252F0
VIFDASKTYVLAISSKSSYVKEFKEIIFENSGTVVTDSTQKQASQTNTGLKEIIESEISKEETVQTLTVKVDNPLNMSPNPAQSNLTIDIKQGDTIKSIEIYTESGSLIGDYTNKVNNNTIDISSLPNAVYIVKVVSITSSSKIIIKE